MTKRITSPELPNRLISQIDGKATIWVEGGDEESYFVNNSGRTINLVAASTAGFISSDDDVIPYSSKMKYSYANVLDGEAVMVEKLDGYYDRDYVHQLFLEIQDDNLGHFELMTLPDKGQIRTQALFWEGDIPSHKVVINKL